MVTSDTERRGRPEYSLTQIRHLAAQGAVRYGGKRVQLDVTNLEYTPEDVHKCLQTLEKAHFKHAERYSPKGPWLDVYGMHYAGPSGAIDKLYIKLKLNRDCTVILLNSFHRDR